MKKWIRWPGLLAFVGLVVLFCLIVFFFIDDFVKIRIEKGGTAIAKAKVELDDAHLSFFPLGLSLNRLQVTDRDEPMKNAVEIAEITFLIDPAKALKKKYYIEEMTVAGLQVNTPRERSGAIQVVSGDTAATSESKKQDEQETQTKQTKEKFELPSFDLPDVKDILKKEPLESLKVVDALRSEMKQEEEKWKKQIADLPNEKTFKAYETRIKKLKGVEKKGIGGILGGATTIISLQKEIKADLKKVREAKKMLTQDLNVIKDRAKALPKVPLQDIERLKEKYALSPKGLSNVSRMFFGDKIGHWTETAFRWHKKIAPHLSKSGAEKKAEAEKKPARGEGIDIHFRPQHPLPNFHVKVTQVSAALEAGLFEGKVEDLTTQQDLTGVPMRLAFSGKALENFESLRFTGEVNRVNAAAPVDRFELSGKGYQVKALTLSKSARFPIVLENASADFETKATFRDPKMDATLSAQVKSVVIAAGKKGEDKALAKAMADALADVKGFALQAGMRGTLDAHDLDLSSDIDTVLKDALGKQVRAQAQIFEKRLNDEITKQVNKAIADLNGEFAGLDGLTGDLTSRLKLGDNVLKDALKKSTGGFKLPF